MALSPDSKTEAHNFSTLGKNVSLFISGYLISKIDGVIAGIFDAKMLLDAASHLAVFRLIGAFAAFILATILTYVIRIYALEAGE
jgi:hypothetical protein